MKIRIKIFNGQLPDYLTVGKVYEVIRKYRNTLVVINDGGSESYTLLKKCGHLNGGSWEVVGDV